MVWPFFVDLMANLMIHKDIVVLKPPGFLAISLWISWGSRPSGWLGAE